MRVRKVVRFARIDNRHSFLPLKSWPMPTGDALTTAPSKSPQRPNMRPATGTTIPVSGALSKLDLEYKAADYCRETEKGNCRLTCQSANLESYRVRGEYDYYNAP